MSSSLTNLHWRSAIKTYDQSKQVADKDLQDILDAANLAPSSFGVQPYALFVVSDPKIRAKLSAAGWNQPAFTEASALIVFASRIKVTEADINAYIQRIASQRKVSLESLADYQQSLLDFVNSKTDQELANWAARQLYIALGVAIAFAAERRIDTTPMEGFSPAQFDEILGLTELGFTARASLAVGYRSADDKYSKLPKVRKQLTEFATYI